MDIRIAHSSPRTTATEVPDFPMARFDTGMVVYQEALINGQYLVANRSAMGRPKPALTMWKSLKGGVDFTHPLRTRQHAFQVEADGQLLVDRWEWVDAREVDAAKPGCRESVITLRHQQRPVLVEVHTRLDDSDFLVRWLAITNTGDRPVALAHVCPWSGEVWDETGLTWDHNEEDQLPLPVFSLGRYGRNEAGEEGGFAWMRLPEGGYSFESMHGRSGCRSIQPVRWQRRSPRSPSSF